ncbi:MAG TPA: ribosome maturation factor RimP [Sulfuricurvum sp.]|nr:MAG: ribosome maturation factor RimP [Campylobacterales bacterium 16-40-21]OZA03022.1 MAG: ribosome maturation factor RimP [Sulfuricurvum sp. 17-40-25]HQS66893.1 ribosome maturation factor RimP [Sulfuricurvum sp.]HQT35631.1 ribosome maturation factor RimP [Sulfuricurvum sp.]
MSLESDIKKMVESVGLGLYDIGIVNENENTIYRVSVTAPGGVSLDQCANLSHLISPLLDITVPVSGDYRLEVSSPGIERRLKSIEHFVQSIGEKVSVTTIEKEKIEGELIAANSENMTIKTKEDGDKSVPFRSINKAKTYFEW